MPAPTRSLPDPTLLPNPWHHVLLIPTALALAALLVQYFGVDFVLANAFFDAAQNTFPARASDVLELLGHRIAKSVVLGVWLLLLATAIAAHWINRLRAQRALLWTTVAAMAAGPIAVVILKDINTHHCPWDLKTFGGTADFATRWFVSRAEAGRCFPGGHASGGFSLIALHFAGAAAGHDRLRIAGLVAALAAGISFSAVRMLQGAHFLSHNLWSAAVVWLLAALIFARYSASRGSSRAAAAPDSRFPPSR